MGQLLLKILFLKLLKQIDVNKCFNRVKLQFFCYGVNQHTYLSLVCLYFVELFSSFLSDINCGDETGIGDLSSLYEMLGETPKIATPLQPTSVRKRSLGRLLYHVVLHLLVRLE